MVHCLLHVAAPVRWIGMLLDSRCIIVQSDCVFQTDITVLQRLSKRACARVQSYGCVCVQSLVTKSQSQSTFEWSQVRQEERLLVYQVM